MLFWRAARPPVQHLSAGLHIKSLDCTHKSSCTLGLDEPAGLRRAARLVVERYWCLHER